ncbi:MAG TPA: glycoside hydrolase family 30 beta sandwich domain-containing protein [Candidatus Ozemobacteraceae bacterium]|nr:glycoside hydrolase family 30 beta sandwich domain-containing protein [Candidatus Ozemobacteraceae bacterium]
MSEMSMTGRFPIGRYLVVAGLLLVAGVSPTFSQPVSPFGGNAQVTVQTDTTPDAAQATPASLDEVIAAKNAIPNFPWNWKKRDQVLLDGAARLSSPADIVALTRESGFKNVREQIILAGVHTPKDFAGIKILCEGAKKQETKDQVLLTNANKLGWEEMLTAAGLASPSVKDRIIRMAMSKLYALAGMPGDKAGVTLWLTDPARPCYLQRQSQRVPFGGLAVNGPSIDVDESSTFQAMDGFGFALTGGSAKLLNTLPAKDRTELLKRFYLPDAGIGASFLRVSIGASDLSPRSFSYDDLQAGRTDTELGGFDISAGDADLIPVLKEILALNPSIRIIATPWSAPPWMKTRHSFIGNRLKTEYYGCYAKYFVKYIQTMRDNGITITAVTPQNEPQNDTNEPSMLMDAGEQTVFIRDHLGPALRDAGLGEIELFCWDHNCDRKEYPLAVLSDAGAREYIAGVAWHLYAGDISALAEVHQAFPDKKMYLTEQWTGKKGSFAGDLRWHLKTVLIGSARNWGQAVLEWNLASDPSCDPHTPRGCPDCKGAVTIANGAAKQPFNVSYYVIGHAAKFARPGSVRIATSQVDRLPNVAFATDDGKIVLIVVNDTDAPQVFNIRWRGKTAAAYLNAGSAGTYTWGR